MRIAVVSDTHGRQGPLGQALAEIAARGIERILHCGDLDEPTLASRFPPGVDFVFGNCDSDRKAIEAAVVAAGGTHHGVWGHLELAGKRIAFVHGDDARLVRELLAADVYDYLFHGHTHVPRDERIGRTRVVNPGALHRATPKTFCIVDLATDDVEHLAVE